MTERGYADHCEEPVQGEALLLSRQCRGRGLRIVQGASGSGWLVDWDESERVFGTHRPQERVPDGIDRGQWRR